jgi:hypothetical protein
MTVRWRHTSYVVRWKLANGNGRSRYDWVLDLHEAGTLVGWQAILDHFSEEGWELVNVTMASWELERIAGIGMAPKYADAYRVFLKQPA